ncbi:lipocalin-like domain-containing protein [Pontivivens nitratireducens]|uniref:Lipocalin-like domain-containing protein n=1 Tax=Pontivivens nitratireducens TaxID=2758038 RepID=A0A6G7VQY8_9RHOB|nr:lipocalin-like domain-containing protein [Pontibrevibacter nitratireducens]QIK42207.1 lipocalin-like domain-containing protein [Pontibrevibacter nitratireducens]
MKQSDILGLWNLVSWIQHRGPDDHLPMGETPTGCLIYTADGQMSAQLMRRDRPEMTTGDFVTGSDEECAAAMRSYLAYCGTYEIHGDEVHHIVRMASYPNWTGQRQVRRVTFEDGRIVLSAAPRVVNGVSITATLTWER